MQIPGSEIVPDWERKDIDHLVGVRTDDMRSENLTRFLFDQRFIAIHPLRKTACGKPVGCAPRLHIDFKSLGLHLALVQADRGDRRHRESHTRHAPVVWLTMVTLQNVAGDDLAVMAGYGR